MPNCLNIFPVYTPKLSIWGNFFPIYSLTLDVRACMLSHFSHVLLFETPRTVARKAPLSMGFSRQEYWSGLPSPLSGDLPDPGNLKIFANLMMEDISYCFICISLMSREIEHFYVCLFCMCISSVKCLFLSMLVRVLQRNRTSWCVYRKRFIKRNWLTWFRKLVSPESTM